VSHLRDASWHVWPGGRVRFGSPTQQRLGTEETEIGINQMPQAGERDRGSAMFMSPKETQIGKRVRVKMTFARRACEARRER
jgi:hypothetical protein